MKKKMLAILIVITLLFVTGCGSKKEDATAGSDGSAVFTSKEKRDGGSASGKDALSVTSKEGSSAEFKADTAETPAAGMVFGIGETMDGTYETEAPSTDAIDADDFMGPLERARDITAGVLTAGEWNDNHNWGFFTNLVTKGQLTFPSFQLSPLNRVVVNVTNDIGPVKNAKVVLYNNEGNILWESVTDYQGTAYAFYQVSNSKGSPASVTVSKDGISETQILDITANQGNEDGQQRQQDQQGNAAIVKSDVVLVTLGSVSDLKALDLMFMFDTTGSMGDELLYLQKEFEDIAQRVSDQSTRYSVNFYRDHGDAYVVKANDFTSDIDEVMRQLNNEYADGGGDYPEAVDKALYNAVYDHVWNKESVKLLFLILDAPPHSGEQVNDTLKLAITEAARQGIRIIPIASSGVDKETETFLRTAAILTGGTYTFLTDHSGVGNSHLEPTIGSYQVELLNDCIVRLIDQYYQ